MSISSQSVCLSCRLRCLSKSLAHNANPRRTLQTLSFSPRCPSKSGIRSTGTATSTITALNRGSAKNRRTITSNNDWPHSAQDTAGDSHSESTSDKGQPDVEADSLPPSRPEQTLQLDRDALDPAAVAQHARQLFGDRLPQGALTAKEQAVYERMYGKPLVWSPTTGGIEGDTTKDADDGPSDGLLKQSPDGEWEEVDDVLEHEEYEKYEEEDDLRLREDMRLQLEADQNLQGENAASETFQRTHPFTLASRSGTDPATIQIPVDGLAGPTGVMLSDVSNKHLDEAAERILGGKGFPYGVGTPVISKQMVQKPIPLTASQSRMTSLEADVFMAALAPGFYSAVLSALVEVRKRLGSGWIESFLSKEGGPQVLDAGAGGAGILAWRDVLSAEFRRSQADEEQPEEDQLDADQPDDVQRQSQSFGKSTVLTGSDALRLRASVLLENTTFLPRLPDYMHVHDAVSEQRKAFDVIIAPYSLWHIKEEHLRKAYVENLWRLLNPQGGVLLLLEKGVPRGFEVIAGARQHLIRDIFASEEQKSSPVDPRRNIPGSVIAPCTNDAKCPMYPVPGISRQRKDYCHFSQRYVRPPYYQRLLGAKSRNHDEIRYSYVAVQKGNRPHGQTQHLLQGKDATDRAFEGYDANDDDLRLHSGTEYTGTVTIANEQSDTPTASDSLTTPPPETAPPHRGTLPRLILPPIKRQGHVILDVCTPSGTLERWTVARSFGQQAYRDARKAHWGDLWALGAKQRVPRRVRLGLSGPGREQDVEEQPESKSKQRVQKRKEEQAKGREKARLRRRQEKAEMGL